MIDDERHGALTNQLSSAIHTEVREMMHKYGEIPTSVIYTALSMQLCSLALVDKLHVHALMEGILKTYRLMEKQDECQDIDSQGE